MISAPKSAGTYSANWAKLLWSRSRNVIQRLRSISRSPLHIEDGASMAFRADEPLTSASIAQPERSTTDGPWRKGDMAPRALGRMPGGHGFADRSLLVRRELRRVVHQSVATMITTLPNCSPD